MSVVGFDFGNQNCYVGVARQGGIEVITNDYSVRATPSCVSYGSNLRNVGTAAWQKVLTNFKNTVFSFKNLLGRSFKDPVVQRERRFLPYELVETASHRIGIKVEHAGSTRVVLPEQVLATQLVKLRQIAEDYLQAKVTNCVLSVPCFWTDGQRRALLDACDVAEIGCLRLLNDTTAVALTYGIYKQEFPAESEQPIKVVFIDVGHSSTQISACAYNKGKLKMLGVVYDMSLGGRDFDVYLFEHFAEEFKSKFKVDTKSSPKATLRLLQECEKLKKQMTADPNKIPLNIDFFMDDKDVSGSMKRSDFEEMCAALYDKFEGLLRQILAETKLQPGDVHSIEMVGGGSRLPKFRTLVKKVFGQEPCTTLNQDEAVARGCTLQSAMLSPAFRVREFGITDVQPFSITLNWETDVEGDGETEVFPAGHPFPFSKVMTFFRSQSFTVKASYSSPNSIPYSDYVIGKFIVKGVTPSVEGNSSKVKLKVRINPNGIFTVCSATLHEKVTSSGPVIVEEPMDTEAQDAATAAAPPTEAAAVANEKAEGKGAEGGAAEAVNDCKAEKATIKTKAVDLPIEEQVICLDRHECRNITQMEREFERMDREEKLRADAQNAVEEYVYEMRNKLVDVLGPYIEEKDRTVFIEELNQTENWLYDDSGQRDKSVYLDKLNQLKGIGDPVVERYREACENPKAFEDLGRAIQQARKAYEQYSAKDPKYEHWEQSDVEKLLKAIEEKQQWLDESLNSQRRHKPTDPPSVFVSQIVAVREAFERVVGQVLNKPKPPSPKQPETNAQKKEAAPPQDVDQNAASAERNPENMETG